MISQKPDRVEDRRQPPKVSKNRRDRDSSCSNPPISESTSSDDADDEGFANGRVENNDSGTDDDTAAYKPPKRPSKGHRRRGVVESEHDSGSVSDDADCSNSDNTNGHGSDSANNSNSDDGESLPPKRLSKDKEWFLPELEDKFETYIDHGCTLDKQGYPIYPKGRTTFLRLPGEQITNFGTVGFSKTCSVNYRRNRTWKVTR
ncbi:hypothetical protein PTTG_01149, partial [Puccinia triticina 1-1 BBBD Race 1]